VCHPFIALTLRTTAILFIVLAGCADDPVEPPQSPPAPPQPVIAYYDEVNRDAKFATRTDGSWTIETIDDTKAGAFITLALDGGGVPHAAYQDSSSVGFRVKYARRVNDNWQREVAASGGEVGVWTSLDLDSQGGPHIGFINASTSEVVYALKSGTAWTTEVVDDLPQGGSSLVLAVDGQDVPHIAYASGSNILFATRAGVNNWDVETASTRRHEGAESRLAMVIDGQNVPHIGSYAVSDGFFHTLKPAALWLEESIDSEGLLTGQHASFALDAQDHLRAAYGEFTTAQLRYGENDGSQWTLDVAVFNGEQVVGMSLALAGDGTPYVSYRDKLQDGSLRMAFRNRDGSWSNESVDASPGVGRFSSLVIR
jgi:hypothetical protein